jgi:hypothetical protein
MFENEEINKDGKDGRMETNWNDSKIQTAYLWMQQYLLSSKILSGIDPRVFGYSSLAVEYPPE